MDTQPINVETIELVKVEEINILGFFSEGGVDNALEQISAKLDQYDADISTEKGRKELGSLAYKVSRAKVLVDEKGKERLAEEKARMKTFDAGRKKWRDGMDAIRDRVRKPLTAWEEAEKEKLAKMQAELEKDRDWSEAIAENDLRERERLVAEREAELKRQEEARLQAEQAEREARERKEREERIAKEAAEKAQRDAEEEITRQRERAEQAERDRVAAEARAKAEKEAAVREAERKAKEEADRKERERLAEEARVKAESERKAANKRHRDKVFKDAIDSLVTWGMDRDYAMTLVCTIAEGAIKNVTINY